MANIENVVPVEEPVVEEPENIDLDVFIKEYMENQRKLIKMMATMIVKIQKIENAFK